MPVIFDANDIEHLIKNFTVQELRKEIKNAREKLRGETEYFWQLYYQDFIDSCSLAIKLTDIPDKQTFQFNNNYKHISVEDIKARYDLVDYIGQYINLRKSGNKFQGLCPFHSDKHSASFFVFPNNTFHCFGCQVHGTIIDFVMKYDNLDFKSALAKLSR